MMNANSNNTKIFFPALLMLFVLSSCNHDRQHPGYVYAPDMMYSEAYDAYTDNPVFKDGLTMQLPVDGTIARGTLPYPYDRTFEGQQRAGLELINPLDVSEEVLLSGKKQYTIYCAICHGGQGDGNGYLYASGLYTAKPTSLIEDYVQLKPEGEIYHVITLGSLSTLMGPHGGQVKSEDRWKIIHYIKNQLPNQ